MKGKIRLLDMDLRIATLENAEEKKVLVDTKGKEWEKIVVDKQGTIGVYDSKEKMITIVKGVNVVQYIKEGEEPTKEEEDEEWKIKRERFARALYQGWMEWLNMMEGDGSVIKVNTPGKEWSEDSYEEITETERQLCCNVVDKYIKKKGGTE